MKRVIQGICLVVALLVLALLLLPLLVNANQFRPRLQAALTSSLGRKVTLGDLSFSLFSGAIAARDLAIAEDPKFGPGPFVTAKSLDLGVSIWPLITAHELHIGELRITDPAISIVQNPSGIWNFSTIGAKNDPPPKENEPLDLSAKLISIANGKLVLTRMGGTEKPMVLSNVNVTAKDFAAQSRFPFSFTAKLEPAGAISANGSAGPINSADASLTPVQLTMKMSGVDLGAIAAGSGMAGVLSVDGSGNLSGTTLGWKGQVRLDKAVLVRGGRPTTEAIELDFAGSHDLQRHSGTISQGTIKLGSAAASLTGSYAEQGAITSLDLRLAGSAMPVSALAGMLPSLNIQLPAGSSLEGGTASVNAAITGPVAGPVVAGSVGVNDTTLKGFNLGSKIGALQKLAEIQSSPNTTIQTLSANIRSEPAGTTIQNLKFIAPAVGQVGGGGTISASHALDFKLSATIGAGIVASAFGGKNTSLPFFVRGTSTNPVFEPDVAGIAAAEAKRFAGAKVDGVDAGSAINALGGLFGKKKK